MNDPSLQPLVLAVHSVPLPDLADPAEAARRRTRAGRLRMLLVLAVCAAPVLASYLAFYVFPPQGRSNYGALIDPPRPWPAAMPLATLDGRSVAPQSLQGQWLLVVVAPAACGGPCERRLYVQRQVREMLGRERDRLDKVWLVAEVGGAAGVAAAVRPELRQALAAPPGPVTVLRASRETLARWLEPEPGRALEEHLYVVDPRGQWVLRVPPDPDPTRLKRDLDRLLNASRFWDLPGR